MPAIACLAKAKSEEPRAKLLMFKLCHYIKDDKKVCNAAAMRRQRYCYHHLEVLRRARRAAEMRQQLLQEILEEHPLSSAPAVATAMERVLDGMSLGRLDKKQSRVILSGLRLMADNIRCAPELAELPFPARKLRSSPERSSESGA